MSDSIQVKRGEKVSAADQKALDPKSIETTLQAPPKQQVEGQAWVNRYAQCPYCGSVGFIAGLNTNFYINVRCGSCGDVFRAIG